MHETLIESARISFVEAALIGIGILWMLGFLRKTVYVPVVIKEEKKKEDEKDVVVKDADRTIYRQKKNPDESYTDYEEIQS